MRKALCLLLVAVCFLPLAGHAEIAPRLDLEGDWYVATLYTNLSYPITHKPGSAADIPDLFMSLTGMTAPALLPLADDAVVIYEQQAGSMPTLALACKDGYTWKCLYNHGSSMLSFADGQAIEASGGQAVDYAFDGENFRMTYMGEEISGTVVAYGENVFELRYTDEEFESYINYGVPSLLFVRADALRASVSIEGDWWAETLFPEYYIELPDWISSMLDMTSPADDDIGTGWMTLGNQAVMRLEKGLAVGCVLEDGKPFVALMRRDSNGWHSYFSESVHSYRLEDGVFIDLDLNMWAPCALDGDVLTRFGRTGEQSGQVVMYNDDVFMWYLEDQEYVENGVNYGVPWMLFVRQSALQ